MGMEVISPVSTIQPVLVTEVLTQTPALAPPSQLNLMTLPMVMIRGWSVLRTCSPMQPIYARIISQ